MGTLLSKQLEEVCVYVCEKLKTELIEGEDKYMKGKLKTWEKHIITNFHVQGVPLNIYCNANFCKLVDGYKKINDHIDKVVRASKIVECSTSKCNASR